MPRLILISDTHEQHSKLGRLPDGDVLVHAGDSTYRGSVRAVADFLEWFVAQPHPHKCLIAGNHDFRFDQTLTELAIPGFTYLHDSGAKIAGLKFWGSPYTPEFYNWAWMYARPTERWSAIPLDTDVLVTHGPPHGILDQPFGREPGVGCEDLYERVMETDVRLHVFGHIHGGYGQARFGEKLFVNASVVNEGYDVVNKPVVVDLEPRRPRPNPSVHLGHFAGPTHPSLPSFDTDAESGKVSGRLGERGVEMMRCGSLFSGIGGFDLGFERAGFAPAWFVERESFCQSVLGARWPNVPIHNDIRGVKGGELERVDVITGGFPCQDLSVAGQRRGLGGERSGLFFEFARVVGELRPKWFVCENVPGLLSSAEGKDFDVVVETLSKLGYGVAWRTLDSQFFGVAQRRRRVFIVGCLGDGRGAAEVLFEPEGVQGDTPPRREKGKELPPQLAHALRAVADSGQISIATGD